MRIAPSAQVISHWDRTGWSLAQKEVFCYQKRDRSALLFAHMAQKLSCYFSTASNKGYIRQICCINYPPPNQQLMLCTYMYTQWLSLNGESKGRGGMHTPHEYSKLITIKVPIHLFDLKWHKMYLGTSPAARPIMRSLHEGCIGIRCMQAVLPACDALDADGSFVQPAVAVLVP